MLAKDGYPVILAASAILVVLALIAWFVLPPRASTAVAWTSAGLLVLIVLFFRDPDRQIESDSATSNVLVAPADGKIIEVTTGGEEARFPGSYRRISIFLSLFDVHVTRIPADGVIESVAYRPGHFRAAWEPSASHENERSEFVLAHPSGARVIFKQIAGLVARRVVYHLSEGDSVSAGERFGLIRFGSRMDVLVPSSVKVLARKGDNVKAGQTVIGLFKDDNNEAPADSSLNL